MRIAHLSMLTAALVSIVQPARAADGVVTTPSAVSVKVTMDRLEAGVKDAGFGVVARIDHAAAATKVGLALRPTELLIFGNPMGGTPLMAAQQTIGLDLPLKVLAWQDETAKVWITYNDPQWLGARHGLSAAQSGPLTVIGAKLTAIATAAGAAP
jgi:uncharacterized protein (DUF302 family)